MHQVDFSILKDTDVQCVVYCEYSAPRPLRRPSPSPPASRRSLSPRRGGVGSLARRRPPISSPPRRRSPSGFRRRERSPVRYFFDLLTAFLTLVGLFVCMCTHPSMKCIRVRYITCIGTGLLSEEEMAAPWDDSDPHYLTDAG